MKPKLEVRSSIRSILSIVILSLVGLAFFNFYFLGIGAKQVRSNVDLFTAIILISQTVFVVFYLLRLFDRKPLLKITDEGIWVRKSSLPFSRCLFIPIHTVYFYHILNTYKRNVSSSELYIRQKDNPKDYKTPLNGIDMPVEKITNVLKFYAGQYGFYDFGEESVKGELFD